MGRHWGKVHVEAPTIPYVQPAKKVGGKDGPYDVRVQRGESACIRPTLQGEIPATSLWKGVELKQKGQTRKHKPPSQSGKGEVNPT